MELWIRSQDKYTLIKAENIKIIETKGLKKKLENSILSYLSDMEQVKSYLKDGYSILANDINIGVYNTKERALEVLDEIQNILKPKLKIVQTDDMSLPIMNGEWVDSVREKMEFDTIQLSTYVYEMPKE